MAPKRKSDYSRSDSFVVADDDGDRDGTPDPSTRATKRSKKTTTNNGNGNTESRSSHFPNPSVSTTQPPSYPPKSNRDSNNDIYWEISKARRVVLNDFKGKKMVSIREYYEKDGSWLPGKKGISMTLEQYGALMGVLPAVERELRRGGVEDVPRPEYEEGEGDGVGAVKGEDEEVEQQGEEIEESGDEDEDDRARARARARANHEATSDEED